MRRAELARERRSEEETRGGFGAAVLALLVLAGAGALAYLRHAPPEPVPADAPGDVFSAERAEPYLLGVVGGGEPRTPGSAASARAREFLLAELRELGLEVGVQESRGVRNVVARLRGSAGPPAILLAAHYDSVPAGPGAADDAAAVAAIVEIARMAASGPPPQRDWIFLLTDGEERGLLGARAFVDEHVFAGDVGVAINLEARGTTGRSLLFETSDGNGWLARLYAGAVRHPAGGSVFFEVYRHMPNDTDFTVFRDAGIEGYNFAFIGSAENYHTANDDLEHLDRGSLQHHGENALALARALDAATWEAETRENATYFDVLGWVCVTWPQIVTLPAAGVLLAVLVIATLVLRAREIVSGLRLVAGVLVVLLAVALAGGASYLFERYAGVFPEADSAWPDDAWMRLGIHAAWGAVAAILVALMVGGIAGRAGLALGVAWWWGAVGLVAAYLVPSGAYLALAPLAGGAVLLFLASLVPRPGHRFLVALAALVFGAGAFVLWIPLELLFYDAMGLFYPFAFAARAAWIATPVLPLFVQR